jgi:hypothetical protein
LLIPSPVEKGGGGGVTTSKKETGFGWLRLIAPCKGPCLGLQLLLPCKSGVGTPKAKGDNPDRKSWSSRLEVGVVGQLPTHHKNIQMLKDLKIQLRLQVEENCVFTENF